MRFFDHVLAIIVVSTLAIVGLHDRAEAALMAGDLVISEVMANPDTPIADLDGEWFELLNMTSGALDLDGLVLSDDGGDSHTISGTLIIPANGVLTLAISATPGGFTPDYVYSGFVIANSADEIVISDSGTEIARLDYDFGFAVAGQSREVSVVNALPPVASDYDLTTIEYTTANSGTPGIASLTVIPEPTTALLLGIGLAGLAGVGRKRTA
jgi:hypothetical protein